MCFHRVAEICFKGLRLRAELQLLCGPSAARRKPGKGWSIHFITFFSCVCMKVYWSILDLCVWPVLVVVNFIQTVSSGLQGAVRALGALLRDPQGWWWGHNASVSTNMKSHALQNSVCIYSPALTGTTAVCHDVYCHRLGPPNWGLYWAVLHWIPPNWKHVCRTPVPVCWCIRSLPWTKLAS